jgi:hypothetical protein
MPDVHVGNAVSTGEVEGCAHMPRPRCLVWIHRMTDDDTELAALLEAERAEFAEMFRLTAKARALEAEHDHRYHHAAVSLQKIAATMGEVDDAMLLRLAKVNQANGGFASRPADEGAAPKVGAGVGRATAVVGVGVQGCAAFQVFSDGL